MRIVFIGQAAFGKDTLQALIDQGENIVGVITIPDIPGQKNPNPVKSLAEEKQLPCRQSAFLKSPADLAWVAERQPDLLVLAFVTAFVPQEMIDLATHGGINYHPSLLPRYRGGSAINWAVINGETETGVTIHQIEAGVDTGPIVLQRTVPVEADDTVKSLYFGKLYPMGIEMVCEAARLIREGKATFTPQDESRASFQPVIKATDTVIDWQQPTRKVYDLIRGANPSPGAGTAFKRETFKIFDARPIEVETSSPAGSVIDVTEDGITIATADGGILVQKVRYSGGKAVAYDFASATDLKPGDRLDG